MINSNDKLENRLKLYNTYKYMAIYYGIPAQCGSVIWYNFRIAHFNNKMCSEGYIDNCYYQTEVYPWLIVVDCLIAIFLYGGFKLYFMSVMKRYYEEGKRDMEGGN